MFKTLVKISKNNKVSVPNQFVSLQTKFFGNDEKKTFQSDTKNNSIKLIL